jgi:hypothetical protein
MARTEAVSVRVEPELKEALEKAAAADDRPVASYLARLMRAHLIEKGFLTPESSPPAPKPPARGRARRAR